MTYISQDFQVGYLSYYRLLIDAQHDFDRICVLDDGDAIVAYSKYKTGDPSPEVLRLLGLPFSHVDIVIPPHNASLFPLETYQSEEKDVYANYLELKSEAEVLESDHPDFDLRVLYQLDQGLYNRWKKIYPEATFVPGFQGLFDQALAQRNVDGAELFIQFRSGSVVDLLFTQDGSVVFFNSFFAMTKEDLTYYLLLLQKQFGGSGSFHKIYSLGYSVDAFLYTALRGLCDELVRHDEEHHLLLPTECSAEERSDIVCLLAKTTCASSVEK